MILQTYTITWNAQFKKIRKDGTRERRDRSIFRKRHDVATSCLGSKDNLTHLAVETAWTRPMTMRALTPLGQPSLRVGKQTNGCQTCFTTGSPLPGMRAVVYLRHWIGRCHLGKVENDYFTRRIPRWKWDALVHEPIAAIIHSLGFLSRLFHSNHDSFVAAPVQSIHAHSFIDSRGSHVCCWTPEMQFMHSRIHCQTGASCWVMLPSFFPFSPARNHRVSTFNEPPTSPSALKTGPVSLSLSTCIVHTVHLSWSPFPSPSPSPFPFPSSHLRHHILNAILESWTDLSSALLPSQPWQPVASLAPYKCASRLNWSIALHSSSRMAFSIYMLAGIVVVVGYVLQKIVDSIRVARFKRQHGCKPEVQIEQSERIIGYDLYQAQKNASKEKRLVEVGRQRYLRYGYTWSGSMMGQVSTWSLLKSDGINDPRNSLIRLTRKISRPFLQPISRNLAWERGKKQWGRCWAKAFSRRVRIALYRYQFHRADRMIRWCPMGTLTGK